MSGVGCWVDVVQQENVDKRFLLVSTLLHGQHLVSRDADLGQYFDHVVSTQVEAGSRFTRLNVNLQNVLFNDIRTSSVLQFNNVTWEGGIGKK